MATTETQTNIVTNCPDDCDPKLGIVFNKPAIVFVRKSDGHACGYQRPNGAIGALVNPSNAVLVNVPPAPCNCPAVGIVTNVNCPIHGQAVKS